MDDDKRMDRVVRRSLGILKQLNGLPLPDIMCIAGVLMGECLSRMDADERAEEMTLWLSVLSETLRDSDAAEAGQGSCDGIRKHLGNDEGGLPPEASGRG
jgi:hypothetical protein